MKIFEIIHEAPEVHLCTRVIKQKGDTFEVVKVIEAEQDSNFLTLVLADGSYISNIHNSLIKEIDGN